MLCYGLCVINNMVRAVSCECLNRQLLRRTPQMIGRQDPYLKLWVGRAGTKVKTSVHVDGSRVATWGESFMFDLQASLEVVVVGERCLFVLLFGLARRLELRCYDTVAINEGTRLSIYSKSWST